MSKQIFPKWLQDMTLPHHVLAKLGVVTAGFGVAYFAFKEIRIALRSMPDESSTSHGGEIVAKVLKAHGVNHIFTLIGGHISPILVASKQLGITVVDFRHEVNCVFAADAMSRLTGITGVAAVTAGPGVTNTITAVKNAQMAQSPLVLIGGAAPTILKARFCNSACSTNSYISFFIRFYIFIRAAVLSKMWISCLFCVRCVSSTPQSPAWLTWPPLFVLLSKPPVLESLAQCSLRFL
jgi:hypothetical protein